VSVNPPDEIGSRLRPLREQFHQASFRYNPYSHSLFEYGEAVADVITSTPEAMLSFYRWAHGFPAGPTYLVEGNVRSDLFGWYMRPRPPSRRLGEATPQPPLDSLGRDDLVRARAEFGELARAAWRCVAALPPEARGLFPGAREDRRVEAFLGGARVAEGTDRLIDPSGVLEAHLWLLALHRIGWRTHRETPGAVQAVRPSLWEWRDERFVDVLDDAPGVKAMWEWIESNRVFDPRDRSVPDVFVSDLPYNIFQASAYAIEWILEKGWGAGAGTPRQAETKPASGQRKRNNMPDDELEEKLNDYIKTCEKQDIRTVARAIGVSTGRLDRAPGWRRLMDARPKKKPVAPLEKPLTDGILAAREAPEHVEYEGDPRDLLEREFLERATSDEKDRYRGRGRAEQDELLETFGEQWKEKADQEAADRKSRRVARRRKRRRNTK
jgi:hypothetical protein